MVGPKSRGNDYWNRKVKRQLTRMHPDGKLEVLSEQVFGFDSIYLEKPGLLISPETSSTALITNLATGATNLHSRSVGAVYSPDGKWFVDEGWATPLHIEN